MRALLNNPWVVGTLAAMALIYLGTQVVNPWLSATEPGAAYDDDVPSLMDMESQTPTIKGPRYFGEGRTQRADIRWLDDIDRNPFGEYLNLSAGSDPGGSTGKTAPGGPALPKLEALFYGRDVKAAVLNSRLRGVGDFIDEFEILSVEPDAVTLGYGGKAYRIEPDAS